MCYTIYIVILLCPNINCFLDLKKIMIANRLCKSDLIHNVIQKFKDGHGRSTVHPMSCRGVKTSQGKSSIISKHFHKNMNAQMLSVSRLYISTLSVLPTANRPARWSRPLRLPLSSIHNSPSKDGFQLFGIWWGDGVSANRQLHQRQPHAPHVRLNGIVSALQSLRLLRNRNYVRSVAGRAKMPRRRQGWAEAWEGKSQ